MKKFFFKRYVDENYCLLSEIYFALQKVFVFETLFISAYLRSWASWAEISVMQVRLLLTAENDVCLAKFWLALTELSVKGALATKLIIRNSLQELLKRTQKLFYSKVSVNL